MDRDEALRLGVWGLRLMGRTAGRMLDDLGELVPPESRSHLLRAEKEVLLAATSALEHHRKGGSGSGRHRPRKIALD